MLLALLAIITILVDNTPPVINILTPNNTISNTSIIKTNIYDNLGIKECYYILNNQKIKFDCNEIKLSSGCYNLTIGAIDMANNENKVLFTTCIDLEPPKIIDYGFYPSNNSIYQNTTYKFWIRLSDDLQISKASLNFNGHTYNFEPSNYIEFNTTDIKIGTNTLEWTVCDISGKCSTLKLLYYVKPPVKEILKFNLKNNEIFLGECQTIEYETNVEKMNLTIIHNDINNTVVLPGKGNYTFCPKEPGLYIINLLGLEKSFNVIYAVNSTIKVVELNKKVKSKIEVKYKNKILYKGNAFEHKVLLPENSYLSLEILNNSLKAQFYNVKPKEEVMVKVGKIRNKNSIIYYIKPNFEFKKVILYLDKENLTYIDVYKCTNYDFDKGCLSSWVKIPFTLEGQYVKIVQDTLSAFMIKQKECKVEINAPNLIIASPNETKCFYVNIRTKYCPKYSLEIEGNYTKFNRIGDLYEICIRYNKAGSHIIKIKYGPFEKNVIIKAIKENVVEGPYIVVIPNKLFVKTYEKNKETYTKLLIKNIGNEGTSLNIYSKELDLNESLFIRPFSVYDLKLKFKPGNYFAKIIVNYSKGEIVVPVEVVYVPDWVNLSLKLLNKEAPYLLKIEVWSKKRIDDVKLCYGIKEEFSKCKLINLTSYQYFIRVLKPKKSGGKVLFAKIGDEEKTIRVFYQAPTLEFSIRDIGMLIILAMAAVVAAKMLSR